MPIQELSLDQIKVLVTSECNLNCTHCFRNNDRKKYFLTSQQLIEIVDFAVKNKVSNLSFSGGEFFVHPFAYELLDYVFKFPINISILTNATDVDIDFFATHKVTGNLSFQVSIDGIESTHDSRRGIGSFALTMETVQKLNELSIPITASMVLDIYNYHDVIDVLNFPYFKKFNFLPLASTENRNSYMDRLSADTLNEYEKIIRLIYKNQSLYMGKEHRCHMFPYGLGIKYNGQVFPCAVARDYGLLYMGDLNTQPLDDIVNNFWCTENGKILGQYQSNDINECNSCDAKVFCNRGCRIRAYKFFGSLDKPDPFCCRLLKNEYFDQSINSLFWGVNNV